MNAVISGQSGVAVLVDGLRLASIHAGSDAVVVDRSPGEVRFLLGEARDLEFLEDVAPEEVRELLGLATTKYDALHLALILLDPELAHDTRRTAAEELEELLADEAVLHWVESVLYARPLPKSGDPVGARSACTSRTRRTRAFLGKLQLLQAVISEVHGVWEGIPTHLFGTDDDRQRFLSMAVREGLFRDLVTLLADERPMDDFVERCLGKPGFGELPNARQALEEWVAGFRVYEYVAAPSTASYVAEARVEYAASERIPGDAQARLRAALDDLPPQMRQVLLLRMEGNLKYREIAEVMQVSIDTVKAHLHQAKQRLRKKLADDF